MSNNCGLVLEGGGMKGLYTAGVLEFFLEQGLHFNYVVGVSAGACMGASYVSRQKGRNKKVNIGLVKDHRYLSWRNLVFRREIFGMDFLFDEVPNNLVPFDFETFLSLDEKFFVGTMDCETGEAIFFEKKELGMDILKIIRASSSLPFIAPPVRHKNHVLLDGGLVDPIPLQKSQDDGNQKNVVIMTRSQLNASLPSRAGDWLKMIYKKYPKVAESFSKKIVTYNQTLEKLKLDIEAGHVYLFQPSMDLPINTFERNQKKLLHLYELGYTDAKAHYKSLDQWLAQ